MQAHRQSSRALLLGHNTPRRATLHPRLDNDDDAMNTIQSVLPADATARVLEEYLASAAQSRESGFDSDEAMSTDSEGSFIDESSSSLATSSDVASAFSSLTLFDRLHTGSIGSDDSGFSSDDEFADDEIR
ncbi:hypothetical protein EVJ58_g10122, partial [Rhodofomes roseus]